VVIPTLNRWGLLQRALSDVLGQQDVDLEVIVVDDGSSDETPRRLAELPDPRVRHHRHEQPLGVARARNDGIALAEGEWLAFLDDDDRWSPRKLRTQLDAASAAASIAYSASIVLDEDGVAQGIDPPPAPDGLLLDLLKHNSIPGGCSNLIARTELVRRVGGFDERLHQCADWDLWIRLAAEGSAAVVRDVHVAYVDHPGSMHVRNAEIAPAEREYLEAKHSALLRPTGIQMGGGAWFHLWVAGGQYRAGDRQGAVRTYLEAARRYRSPGALRRAVVCLVSDRLVLRDVRDAWQPVLVTPDWLAAAGPLGIAVETGERRPLRAGAALERRIAGKLGLSPQEGAILSRRAERALGPGRYFVYCVGFLLAAGPLAPLLPRRARSFVMVRLLQEMLFTAADSMGYLGLRGLPSHRNAGRGLLAGAPGDSVGAR